MMRITLLRHGKPSFELKGKVRGRDLGSVAKSYDLSGIEDAPPEETLRAMQKAPFVVCSQLRRSVESAEALGFSQAEVRDPLFDETLIPTLARGVIPLPLGVWILVLRLMWMFGFSRNGESLLDARKRAKQAAARLVEFAEEHGDVLLVGHGFINYFIAKELRKSGWLGPSRPGNGYWGYACYERGSA
jgi:broad specificity phosphatase PhoE